VIAPPGGPPAGIAPLLTLLCDDAAMFPPGNAPAVEAVPAHREHRAAWYHDLVGPFLVAATRISEVAEAARAGGAAEPVAARGGGVRGGGVAEPLALVLVVPEGPAAVGSAIRAVLGERGIELVGVELACGPEGTPAEAAHEAAEALADVLPAGVGGVIEVRRGPGFDPALDEALDVLAGGPFRAKFRTGGTVASAFPTEEELAGFLEGCVARGLPFKCTAGLHEAARHTDKTTGFEHHGFLNVLLATHVAHQGGDVAAALRVRSGPELADGLRRMTPEAAVAARRAFTAYGTCSITEPLAELTALGLVVPEAA
jgi:hypothetical protein